MFVRLVRTSVTFDRQDPAWEQEAARHVERTIAYMRQQPGFRRYMTARDASGEHGIAITEWETQEQAQQFTQRADLAQEVTALGVRLESIEVFEVGSITELTEVVA